MILSRCAFAKLPFTKLLIVAICAFEAPFRSTATNHRVFFREHDDRFQIERVLDRKEAYR
jgi:hypothetical protein